MKTLKQIIIGVSLLSPLGCATMRQPLLTTPAVSMTDTSTSADRKLVDLGPVESRFCYGDEAISRKGDTVGLMDEVILKAQKEKNASYIKDAKFAYEGSCIVLEGTAVK